MSINLDNLHKWTAELRNPARLQATGKLAKHTIEDDPSSPVGYCCLGVGCEVAGITAEEYRGDDEDDEVDIYYEGEEELPPSAFADFLGLAVGPRLPSDNQVNPYLDTPDDLLWRDGQSMNQSLPTYNDGLRLTFPQIADLIDYFGVTL